MDADAPIDVVRHEERLRVRTVSQPVERIRFEKVLVTEERTITVTVSREELRLVREPVHPGAPGRGGEGAADDGPRVVEMVLHEEQLTVERRVVPVERVRLIVDRVVTPQSVDATLAHEIVDVDRSP